MYLHIDGIFQARKSARRGGEYQNIPVFTMVTIYSAL